MRITTIILLLVSFNLNAQDELSVEQNWSNPKELPFQIMSSALYFTKVDGEHYAEFEIRENDSVSSTFYMNIDDGLKHASFLKIDKNLSLVPVTNPELTKELFFKTDYRTEWSTKIFEGNYDRIKNSDGTLSFTREIICSYKGNNYKTQVSYTKKPFEWNLITSSIISNEKGLDAIYLCPVNIGDTFANVFFIHFSSELKDFEIIKKNILYSDFGFNANEITPITNYGDYEFLFKDTPGLLFRFNLNNSSSLGLSTVLFDLEKNEININSKQFDNKEINLIPDFNEAQAKIKSSGEFLDYFINLSRTKMSKGNKSNTGFDADSGEDVLYVRLKDKEYSEAKGFKNVRKNYHLLKTSRLNEDFYFIYDEFPEEISYDDKIILGKDSSFKLWIIQFSKNKTILYEIGFDYSEIDSSINDNYISFDQIDNSTINIVLYLSGSMFKPTNKYLIGKINITANKRH
ncbi:MAG: hypothetical protein COA32_15155 [Fluviicola sp.]|nr:MAG: hypothetical protein COA32_15155 [Fluviicola sp.]